MSDLAKHLRAHENVLWSGKPVSKAFILPVFGGIPIALFFILVFVVMVLMGAPPPIMLEIILFAWVIILIILLPMWQILRYRNTEYLITDKRVIIQSGAIGKDTRFVELCDIQEAKVKIGMVDKWFGTGSILIPTAGQAVMGYAVGDAVSWHLSPFPKITPNISAIRKPYEVVKLLQKAIERVQPAQTL